ncbi:MAG: putative zinc-binding protein [Candidatus Thermoplasmatota archaeon]|nr:putative zinc-binding protein [Candidatus Thermoplasmatota archaeon]
MKKIGILPCSGACNVGALSNKAVVNTMKEKENTDFVCALGLPLGIEGIIKNGKSSDEYIALNGCKVRCATKALKSAEIPVNEEIVITERYDIEKTGDLRSEEKLDKIIDDIENLVDKLQKE